MKKMFCTLLWVALCGCSTSGKDGIWDMGGNVSKNSQTYTINSKGGVYKVGNPYQIFGTWYYPKEDYGYSEVGTASWYGEDFHAKSTANGEEYDMHSLTAAHRTLPLPSIVKVTNLENGRSVILRVNDRGPYAKNRIIDVSKRGAEILGYQGQGTARVKVEVLPEESKKLKMAMLSKDGGDAWVRTNKYQTSRPIEVASATVEAVSSEYSPKYVQAGSFASYDSAYNLKNQLSKYGKSFIAESNVNGSKYYRVRLGPYRYDAEAEVVLNKVKDYGIYNARVVSN